MCVCMFVFFFLFKTSMWFSFVFSSVGRCSLSNAVSDDKLETKVVWTDETNKAGFRLRKSQMGGCGCGQRVCGCHGNHKEKLARKGVYAYVCLITYKYMYMHMYIHVYVHMVYMSDLSCSCHHVHSWWPLWSFLIFFLPRVTTQGLMLQSFPRLRTRDGGY